MSRQGFDKIVGQELAKRVLRRAVREQDPAHAYLFLGLEGTGKLMTAMEFAKALNCENPQDGDPCGECALCHMIEHGNLPDVRIWSPRGRDTKIDDMREMRELAMLRPMRSKWKINIIEQGDTLNEDSANCILKLVEEPPDYLINILLYRNPAMVLATIRSRCQLVRFTQANAAELVDRLIGEQGVTNDEARFLAAYSQGCPGRAIRLIGDTEFLERRDAIAGVAAAAGSGSRWSALKLAEALRISGKGAVDADEGEDGEDATPDQSKKARKGVRDSTVEALDMLLVWYRDLLAAKLQEGDAALVNVDRRDEIVAQTMTYPHAGRLMSAIESIVQAKRAVVGNANPQIVTEALMVRLTG